MEVPNEGSREVGPRQVPSKGPRERPNKSQMECLWLAAKAARVALIYYVYSFMYIFIYIYVYIYGFGGQTSLFLRDAPLVSHCTIGQ